MARAKDQSNGNGHLDVSLNALIQAQALLVQTQTAAVAQKAEADKRMAENEKELIDLKKEMSTRFARIEAILVEHTKILQRLPEAIREKIGFKTGETPKP